MYYFFGDDSSHNGAREKVGKTVAYGGILVPEENLIKLGEEVDKIALEAKIPEGEEIKWSPQKSNWMYSNLIGDERTNCFNSILESAYGCGVKAFATVCDPNMANLKPEWGFERCVTYTLERVSTYTEGLGEKVIVISDKPGGGKKEEEKFLSEYLEHLESEHNFMLKGNFALNMLTGSSQMLRQLQVADLVCSITSAMISGNTKYATAYFDMIKKMFVRNHLGYIGGTGLKVYPDNLINLYHWVLGEDTYAKVSTMSGIVLPRKDKLYAENGGT